MKILNGDFKWKFCVGILNGLLNGDFEGDFG